MPLLPFRLEMSSSLVSSVWLRKQLVQGLKNIRVVDASWGLDTGSEEGRSQFNKERIEGAVFFDIDEMSDKTSEYEHMLPSAQIFQEHVGKMGISNSNHVVVYDRNEQYGLFSAPRVWWMFRAFGHGQVSVLDGGLMYWKWCQHSLETGSPQSPVPQSYTATHNPQLVRTMDQVLDHLSTSSAQIVDARSQGRFNGTAPEPRPSFPSGHMIGAKNVPYMNLLNSQTKLLKSKGDLRKVFESAGVDLSLPMVSTCGSGVTAAIITLAAHLLNQEVPLYDGSWVQWVQAAPPSTRTNQVTEI